MLKKLKTWIFKDKVKAVIFDYDGVLNDSLDVVRELYNEFYRRGITNLYFKDNKEFSYFFQGDTHKNMEAAGMETTEENFKKCNDVVKEFLTIEDSKAELYKGVNNLLLKLKDGGYKIGIVSNGNKGIIKAKLKKYGLESTVKSIIGYEEVNRAKPSPEGLLKCLEELKIKPKNALYVGDMESDIKAAKAACVKIIAVTYGYYNLRPDKFEKLKEADMLASTIDEIYERIKHG